MRHALPGPLTTRVQRRRLTQHHEEQARGQQQKNAGQGEESRHRVSSRGVGPRSGRSHEEGWRAGEAGPHCAHGTCKGRTGNQGKAGAPQAWTGETYLEYTNGGRGGGAEQLLMLPRGSGHRSVQRSPERHRIQPIRDGLGLNPGLLSSKPLPRGCGEHSVLKAFWHFIIGSQQLPYSLKPKNPNRSPNLPGSHLMNQEQGRV